MFEKTIEKCAATAARIAKLDKENPLAFWISSAMAGAYVGLGIILIFTLGNSVDPSIRPLVMGSFFGIALTLVIIAGSELYTGHTMFLTLGVKAKTISLGRMCAILPKTWLGNLIGSVGVALLYYYGFADKGAIMSDGALIHKVAVAKSSGSVVALFSKAMLCNWLVCLAIWMAQRTDGAARFLGIWWCLLAFIASGFEHSIANMTVFALSWFGETNPALTLSGIGHNLLWVSLGNAASGIVFMGLGYWYSTPKADRPAQTEELESPVEALSS